MTTYYDILGVSPDAEDVVISAAYRALMRKYHPDVNSAADAGLRAKEITEAYETLADRVKRAAYDERLKDSSTQKKSGQSREGPTESPKSHYRAPHPEQKKASKDSGTSTFTDILYITSIAVILGLFARSYLGIILSESLLFGGLICHVINMLYVIFNKKKTWWDD